MEKSLTSKNGKAQQTKVWSCGYEDCPHDRYWPRQFLYTTVYEHHVWGSDKKFRNGEDTCGMPQFIFLADLEGAAVVSRKYSHNPVLRIPAGTEMKWRQSSVGLGMKVQIYPLLDYIK